MESPPQILRASAGLIIKYAECLIIDMNDHLSNSHKSVILLINSVTNYKTILLCGYNHKEMRLMLGKHFG